MSRHDVEPDRLCRVHPEKHRYLTQAAANAAAKSLRRKARFLFRSYECPDCGGFHLTTKGRR